MAAVGEDCDPSPVGRTRQDMSWTIIPKQNSLHCGRQPATGVRVSIDKKDKGSNCAAITLCHDVLETLGWTPGIKIAVHRGTDEHHGWLRLTVAPEGFKLSKQHGKTARQCLVAFSVPGFAPHLREPAEYAISNGALLVKMPSRMLEPHAVAAE